MRFRHLLALALCLLPSLAAAQDVRSPPGLQPTSDATLRSLITSGAGAAGAANIGGCNASQWTGYIGGTQSPMPACFGLIASPSITTAFPALVGIGDASGAAVPVNDQTYLQRAQHLIQAKTALDNTKQEAGLAINFLNQTGGGGLAQTNHNQKVGLSVFALGVPGGSNMWAINTDIHVNSNFGQYPFYGREADHTNFNGDYKPGGCAGTCPAGQIGTVAFGDYMTFTGYPLTAGASYTGSPNSNSFNLHYGLMFQNGSYSGTTVGQGLIGDALIVDSTNSPVSLKLYGNHTTAIDTTTAASLTNVLTATAGQKACLNGLAGCLLYDTSKSGLSYNGGAVVLSDTGTVTGTSFLAPGTSVAYVGNSRGGGLSVSDAGGTLANLVNVQPATAGFGPTVNVSGTDTNIHLNLQAKGTGSVRALGTFLTTGLSTFQAGVKLAASTIASLPTCNASNQDLMYVATDATAPTYRGALTGGGTVRTLVYCDGSSWSAH